MSPAPPAASSSCSLVCNFGLSIIRILWNLKLPKDHQSTTSQIWGRWKNVETSSYLVPMYAVIDALEQHYKFLNNPPTTDWGHSRFADMYQYQNLNTPGAHENISQSNVFPPPNPLRCLTKFSRKMRASSHPHYPLRPLSPNHPISGGK